MKHSHNNNHIQKAKTDEHNVINIKNKRITKRILKSLELLNKKNLHTYIRIRRKNANLIFFYKIRKENKDYNSLTK